LETVLEYLPQRPGIGENGSDLVGEVAPAIEAEVGRLLLDGASSARATTKS